MKIVLVRHAKDVDSCSSENLKMPVEGRDYRLYSSPAGISKATADAMFGGAEYEATYLLREVGEKAEEAPGTGESESLKAATARARRFIDMAEDEGFDVIAISHERFLKILFKELRHRGYNIRRSNLIRVDYLEKAVATKQSEHCGRCSQNCHLSNPGCDIGREKARKLRDKNW